MKKWGIVLLVILVVVIGVGGTFYFFNKQQLAKISSYEECVKAGFPSLESYPSQCNTSDGRNFTQNIGNELEYVDEIIVNTPRPNQEIISPQIVEGKARGQWFFEANFSGELFDENKTSLGTVILQSTGDWMTEDFVPFHGELKFSSPHTRKGELVIKNANPSGLPENEKTLRIPVVFQ